MSSLYKLYICKYTIINQNIIIILLIFILKTIQFLPFTKQTLLLHSLRSPDWGSISRRLPLGIGEYRSRRPSPCTGGTPIASCFLAFDCCSETAGWLVYTAIVCFSHSTDTARRHSGTAGTVRTDCWPTASGGYEPWAEARRSSREARGTTATTWTIWLAEAVRTHCQVLMMTKRSLHSLCSLEHH